MRHFLAPLAATLLLTLTGCIIHPKINPDNFQRPMSVAIVVPPPIKHAAQITLADSSPDFHFSPAADYFFRLDDGGALLTSAPRTTAHGLIGVVIDAVADSTNERAMEFHSLVEKEAPGMDLRSELVASLQKSFEAKSIKTILVNDSRDRAPRLRWPAAGEKPAILPIASGDLPTADADLIIQLSPVVFYGAPGALNNYVLHTTVGIALYNGRTKAYIGRQRFSFTSDDYYSYHTYTVMVEDIKNAVARMRPGLMALVPDMVAFISKEKKAGE